MGSFKSSTYSVLRWGNRSPEWRGRPRLRFVNVCTRPNLCARPDKLWLPPLTAPQPTATNHQEDEPTCSGTVQTAPSEALASPEVKYRQQDRKCRGFDQWETGKGRDPGGELLVFCFSDELVQGREFLKCSLSGAIPHDQMPTSVLCWSSSQLSNTPPFLPQIICPPHSHFSRIACSTTPPSPNKVLAPNLLFHALPSKELKLRHWERPS